MPWTQAVGAYQENSYLKHQPSLENTNCLHSLESRTPSAAIYIVLVGVLQESFCFNRSLVQCPWSLLVLLLCSAPIMFFKIL